MKQILLAILCASFATGLYAQITLNANYFPAIGDTLRITIDGNPTGVTLTPPGIGQVWDFSQLTPGEIREQIVTDPALSPLGGNFPSANLQMNQIGGGEGFYLANETSFSIVGYGGQDPIGQGFEVEAPFNPPYVERWAPLALFDARSSSSALTVTVATADIPGGIFDNLPVAPDSIRVRVAINRSDVVEGSGTLTIPQGQFEVLRERRIEYRDVRLDARLGVFWLDITDLALANLPIDEIGTDTIIGYYHWSNMAKEPIAIINVAPDGTTIESVAFKHNPLISSVRQPQIALTPIEVFPNPGNGAFALRCANLATGRYQVQAINQNGQQVAHANVEHLNGTNAAYPITWKHLPQGQYQLLLLDAQGQLVAQNGLVIFTE